MQIFIGNIIKKRRIALRFTQEMLSKLTGVSLRTIGKIENDCGNPSLDAVCKIAETLGLEITLQVKK